MVYGKSLQSEHDLGELLIARDLSRIDTSYGKLVYLASLRNPDTGRYDYFGSVLATQSNVDASRSLRKAHELIFKEWVTYSLRDKKTDIELYIGGIGEVDRIQLIDAWLRMTPYKNLVPASIQGPEREKHVSDFEAILGLLKNVYGVASPDLTV